MLPAFIDQQDNHGGDDCRQIDMDYPLQLAGAVHHGRLMELLVHAGKSCQINDGAPAHILPDAGPYIKMGKDGCISHIMQVVRAANIAIEMVQNPDLGERKTDIMPTRMTSGNKVRHIGDRLRQL